MAFGVRMGIERYNLDIAARVEEGRTAANERMAAVFDQTDFIICASNPLILRFQLTLSPILVLLGRKFLLGIMAL
ncbi:MAG: hypothetical protein CM15mP49_35390 [Actinomycetota bacterium]|nr:MAG: hypothetical protein CM15mP49_35390 [Actinomycetota bacterium]